MSSRKVEPNQKKTGKKNIHIDFKNLNESNKQQFLDFLIQNNITFEKCDGKNGGDYVAKVTIMKNGENNNGTRNKKCNEIYFRNENNTKIKDKNTYNSLSNEKKVRNEGKIRTPEKYQVSKLIKRNNGINGECKEGEYHIYQQKNNSGKEKQRNKTNYKNKTMKSISTNNKQQYNCSLGKSIRTTEFQPSDSREYHPKTHFPKQKPVPMTIHPKQKPHLMKPLPPLPKPQITTSSKTLKHQFPLDPQKTTQINKKIRKKIELQKSLAILLNKLLKLFDLKLQGIKPIKWSLHQLIKNIQDIYVWIFNKNYFNVCRYQQQYWGQIYVSGGGNGNNGNNGNGNGNGNGGNGFIKFVKEFFGRRYKNQKQANTNLTNMIYSLSLYLQNEKKLSDQLQPCSKLSSNGITIKIFKDFVCGGYQFEDILFYLFVRNIVGNEIKNLNMNQQVREKLVNGQNKIGGSYIIDVVFGLPDIDRMLKLILGQDQQLLQQYTSMILQHLSLPKQNKKIPESQLPNLIKIPTQQFMMLLLEDYKKKRVILQQSLVESTHKIKYQNMENCSATSENTVQLLLKQGLMKLRDEQGRRDMGNWVSRNFNESNELTFGEEIDENNIDHSIEKLLSMNATVNIDKQFWESNLDMKQYDKYEQDTVEYHIVSKMRKKVKQFMSILIQNQSQYPSIQRLHRQNPLQHQPSHNSLLCMELLMRKSLNLLSSILQMNKIQWFDDLNVGDPSQDDIERVEQLQLAYMKIKDHNENQEIAKLCKNILTTPQVMVALEKLMNREV